MTRRPALFSQADIRKAQQAARNGPVELIAPNGTTMRFLPPGTRIEATKSDRKAGAETMRARLEAMQNE